MHLFNKNLYKNRRENLLKKVKEEYNVEKGLIVLLADLENIRSRFLQESSFFYFTGINEPGVVLVIDIASESSSLLLPNFGKERSKWMTDVIQLSDKDIFGFSSIEYLGTPLKGYQLHPYQEVSAYQFLLEKLQHNAPHSLFTLLPATADGYFQQRFLMERLSKAVPTLISSLVDISKIVATLRRKKDAHEIALLRKAIAITEQAQYNVAQCIKEGIKEQDLQAVIESTFMKEGAQIAFNSIVASGINSTILHYNASTATLAEGDLLVVDIGAQYNNYCADITRTYPVDRKFTKRQQEIYELVLEAQNYIATKAAPGMWLSYAQQPDHSLNHLAKAFFEKRGYKEFFVHGIGHFLGLDVHDVGDYTHPLEEGDVITIEPGLYIREEKIGVRIEDDYYITSNGAECLSKELPKSPEGLINIMK